MDKYLLLLTTLVSLHGLATSQCVRQQVPQVSCQCQGPQVAQVAPVPSQYQGPQITQLPCPCQSQLAPACQCQQVPCQCQGPQITQVPCQCQGPKITQSPCQCQAQVTQGPCQCQQGPCQCQAQVTQLPCQCQAPQVAQVAQLPCQCQPQLTQLPCQYQAPQVAQVARLPCQCQQQVAQLPCQCQAPQVITEVSSCSTPTSQTILITDSSPEACKNLADTLQLMIVCNLLQSTQCGQAGLSPFLGDLVSSPLLSCGCGNPLTSLLNPGLLTYASESVSCNCPLTNDVLNLSNILGLGNDLINPGVLTSCNLCNDVSTSVRPYCNDVLAPVNPYCNVCNERVSPVLSPYYGAPSCSCGNRLVI